MQTGGLLPAPIAMGIVNARQRVPLKFSVCRRNALLVTGQVQFLIRGAMHNELQGVDIQTVLRFHKSEMQRWVFEVVDCSAANGALEKDTGSPETWCR